MKTFTELQTALKLELNIWFKRQTLSPYSNYYLYYLPTTEEHNGKIIIAENTPMNKEYQLAMPERINKGWSIEQNFNYIFQTCLSKLPVLS